MIVDQDEPTIDNSKLEDSYEDRIQGFSVAALMNKPKPTESDDFVL